jgi:hypothetical protein
LIFMLSLLVIVLCGIILTIAVSRKNPAPTSMPK